ncbi:hypothetical protein AB4238_03010 [Shewanella sp. 10N.286.45.A1]|uniref:hypothetical protein n=1 Tax=Shewanella sp. 10N.286.45.A1 TaxID=3229694 RepID=UPI0035511694
MSIFKVYVFLVKLVHLLNSFMRQQGDVLADQVDANNLGYLHLLGLYDWFLLFIWPY